MGPIPFASPSSIVPDSIRNLIPRGDEKIYGAAGCYSGSCVTESADADSQRKDQASHASHNSENSTQPLPHKTHALPIPSLNVEFPRFPLGPAVLQVPGSAIEAPIFNLTTKAFTVVFSLHTAGSSVTSATAKEVDCTTTLTEWITVTPTSTSNALKYTSAHKETHQVLLPKPSGPQTKTEAVLLPKPSASHTQTPAVVSMILTVETLLPGPTSTSFSTVASYTPLQKPAELPPSSHISSQYKSGSYNAPSNTAATHSAEDLMLVVTKPTRYVTPIPVAQPSWSRIQNSSSTGMAKPQQPEQYMGAAVTNSLDVVFLIVAGVAALMTI
ncbi:uncharacterized protein RCC_01862 [Ramularia collo-cygni]|uniref:Uncharacterized protein n=1 Tax=Ramularia collo-cygni TaxID=112498 RepID=A0A2D3UM44_9PEZI|nr:uncharacterized protein RCC_01862 [Ramularia collo-cygni]CZT16022.1 uncharacterized protein RCC_01862 [Ramularia collo-cygni]